MSVLPEVGKDIYVPPPPPVLPEQVRAAAARGWEIFPLRAGTKDGQLLTSWKNEATSDLAQLQAWAAKWPGCNWGCATGARSGVFVIDTDSADALIWAVTHDLPTTYTVKTGKDDPFASHFYFRQPSGMRIKCSAKEIGPGVDVRGDGGYVVISPSIHPSGKPYSITADGDLAEAPDWLIELVKDDRAERSPVAPGDIPQATPRLMEYGRNIYQKMCREFAELPAGTGVRNRRLYALGCTAGGYIASGYFDLEFAQEHAFEAAANYFETEGEGEAKNTFNSGIEDGLQSPLLLEEASPEEAGFGQAPLPAEASLTPVAGGPRLLLSPTDRALLNVGTQHSIALIFAQRLEGKMLYDHTRGAWLEWDGTRWKLDRTRRVYNAIREICAEKNDQHKASMASASFCEGVEKHLKNDPKFARTSDQFDRDNYLLNTPAGTIDLRTGERRAHSPADLLTLCTSVAPVLGGGEEFNGFLSGITQGDVSLCNFHQVSLGACLSGAIELHYLTFWIGNGRNGKNTLGDLIEDAMGDYAKKIPASTLMSKSFESHPTEVANLKGVRLATSSEVNDGDHWDEARINEVTGDATLSGRVMRGDFFEFKRTHKHLIYGNYSPQLRSVSDGIRSRIKIVPFKASFVGREDTDLPARLRHNLGYVMAWLIDGHRKWLENGKKLPACAAVEAESAQYFEQQATPALWLQERCELVPADGRSTPQLPRVSDLYRDYREWKERRGELPVSQKRWTDAAMRGFEKAHSNAGWHLRGVTLRPRVDGMPFCTGVPFPPPSKTVVQ